MKCPHCCFSCTEDGEDMSFDTFKKACSYGSEFISIGGGEPTLHPELERFIFHAMAQKSVTNVWMATNGSNTELSLTLLELATKTNLFHITLSNDIYHDPIDNNLIDKFVDLSFEHKSVEVRNVEGAEANAGRCDFGEDACVCPGLFIGTDGTAYGCGCIGAKVIGNVFNGYKYDDSKGDLCSLGKWYKK